MRYIYVILIAVGILVLLVLLGCLLVRLRMYLAAKKVGRCSYEEKRERLNGALYPFGFCYDEENDAVCSRMYCWQRETGYCRAYDEGAAAMYMVFDCEPVYFAYGGRRYLIEVWKGQYGCTTGAEIGVYVSRDGDRRKAPEKLFYECVEDEERLPMYMGLYRDGEKILERSEVHWWLTDFQPGMYSESSELLLDVGITFPNAAMCRAFYEGLLRTGYSKSDVRVEQNRVFFSFEKSHTSQPAICDKRCCRRIQRRNRRNCKLYCRVTRRFCSTLDKITYIGFCFPVLYRSMMRLGMKCNGKKLKKYRKKWL